MRDVLIGDRVRVKRGAQLGTRGQYGRAEGNRVLGTVRQVWRGDRLAQVTLDDGRRAAVRLRDLRTTGGN